MTKTCIVLGLLIPVFLLACSTKSGAPAASDAADVRAATAPEPPVRPPPGPPPRRGPPFERHRGDSTNTPEATTLAANPAEKKALEVLAALDKQRRGNMNVPIRDGRLLRLLVEAIGAKRVVEVGTSNGYSAIWMCLGLRNTGGALITYELDPNRAAKARANFAKAGVKDLVTLVEGDAHEEVAKLSGTIDMVFLDADKEGYLDYLDKLLALVRPGGIVAAHNMVFPPPDPKFVEAITSNPKLETLFLHMETQGMAVSVKKRVAK
jgi:predicted O-methyltransferase YrrM